MASRALNVISRILIYAVNHELRDSNPAHDIKPSDLIGSVRAKNFASIESKELPELLKKISGYQGLLTRYAMELMALTFVRTSELIQAKWSEFDFDNKRWVIPAERMKKAKGMQAAHIVPLATQTLTLLQQLKTISGASTFLFPGLDARKPISNNTILMALKNLGYKGRMTGHGFRSVASTVLHEQGFNHLYIERQLSHMERDEVAAAYNYAEYLEQRTAMMQWWADYLEEARK
jgi:integrase